MFNAIKNFIYGSIKFCLYAIVFLTVLVFFFGGKSGSGTGGTSRVETRGDQLAHVAHELEHSIERQMRNPDSYDLIESWANPKTGAVCLKYRAQNGFGGMNVERAGLHEGDTAIMTQNHPDFEELWGECTGLGSVGGGAIYRIRG